MPYEWLDAYLRAKPGAEKDYKPEWEATRYMVRGKMFCMIGHDKASEPIISLKLDPARGDHLRQTYEDIIPGYYMNKDHWNSVYIDGEVPDDVLRGMADESHRLIFAALSQKAQREILG